MAAQREDPTVRLLKKSRRVIAREIEELVRADEDGGAWERIWDTRSRLRRLLTAIEHELELHR